MLADRPLRLAATALAAAFALSACSETTRITPNTEHATAVAVATVPATVYPAPTTPPPPAPTGSGSAKPSPTATKAAGGGNTVLATGANTFDPQTLKVKKGAKVTWTAEGFHTVTSGTPESGPDPKGPMKGEGGFTTYSVTFKTAGTYKYFCEPHATLGMVGEIVVS